MNSKGLPLLLVLALVTVGAASLANTRDEQAAYVTGADVVASCTDNRIGGLLGVGVGETCFDVRTIEDRVEVRIDDDFGGSVGGALVFEDAQGDQIGEFIPFCVQIEREIPDEAVALNVRINGPYFQVRDCPEATPSTRGTVFATFIDTDEDEASS